MRYPWIKEAKELPDTVNTAIARMKSTEKRLFKLGAEYTNAYQYQIEEMIRQKCV